jgi:hypothetical protein
MLQLLTNYLFQYKKVSVPHVGTIQLVQHPPVLLLVDKKLQPPSFSAELKREEAVSDHQLNFLGSFLNGGKDVISKELSFFGDKLQEKINGPGFEWIGLGTITKSIQIFPININGFETIRAEKIIRQDTQHAILVGDKEMTSVQMTERRTVAKPVIKKSSTLITVGWTLLGLSILAIAIFLYIGKFKVNAAGSKQSPIGFRIPNSS